MQTDLDITLCSFPSPKEGLEPTIEVAKPIRDRVRYINLIPKVIPYDLEQCARYARDWVELGAEAGIPVYIETHRHCMTNDLMFTLHLLEAVPELMMVSDLSHVLVNQEWGGIPTQAPEDVLTDEEHSYLSRLLRRVESIQGRVATREQIQTRSTPGRARSGTRCSSRGGRRASAAGGIDTGASRTRASCSCANWARRSIP